MFTMGRQVDDHQVFFNYRGEELRYGFVSHLSDAFERDGIEFIIDTHEQRGNDLDNLFVRIKQSRIALAIFSTRYAESSWCMDELVKMKKLAEKGRLQVIPIFYKVRARDVRGQTGVFGEKFWELAKVSRGDQIMKWKNALEYISEKMGLSLGEKCYEAEFIKEIIKEVKRVVATVSCEQSEDSYLTRFENKKRKIWNCPYEVVHFRRSKSQNMNIICGKKFELFYD